MTLEQLQKIAVNTKLSRLELFYPFLIKYMTQYEIDSKGRISAFIAQVLHESGGFRYTSEIASGKAYENRKDLGNAKAGDGVRFKGRGLIQITGRSNYAKISVSTGIDFLNHPELLETIENATMSACWWWNSRGLNKYADLGKFNDITKIINGGYNGMEERQKYYDLARKVL